MSTVPDLEHLIRTVVDTSGSQEPLDRLAAAVGLRDELDALADAVLDHFVEEARDAGCSWSRIGAVLGVTKQAAQQRHATGQPGARRLFSRLSAKGRSARAGLFRRFTPPARDVAVRAQAEARALGHGAIGAEHLLLGLLYDGEGVVTATLASLGLDLAGVREQVQRLLGVGARPRSGHIPFTAEAKQVMEQALHESADLGHDHIGPEHILLALTRLDGGAVTRLLAARGTDADHVRAAVAEHLDDLPGQGR